MQAIGELPLSGGGNEPVDLRRVMVSHGVATLAPNHVDLDGWELETTVDLGGTAHTLRVTQTGLGMARIQTKLPVPQPEVRSRLLGITRHMLRLDEDLSAFYARAAKDRSLSWVTSGAGRMLRSPTVFEDVVKTICTTNCAISSAVGGLPGFFACRLL